MKKVAVFLTLGVFLTVSCVVREQESHVSNVNFTPCQQTKAKSDVSDRIDVEFTNEGVQITYYNFVVTCDFATVNVTHTFAGGVLSITQEGSPNQADCVCYTDVSYTVNGISQDEVNVIFINGEQVYCYNDNGDCSGDVHLKIGEVFEIKSGEDACNAQYGLSLRIEKVNDSRCPIGVACLWAGNASVQFHLSTKKGEYSFTLDTYQSAAFKSDTIIEGMKYRLRNVLPYPVVGEELPLKTVRILVENNEEGDDEYFDATVLGKGMDCGNSFLIQFDAGVTGLPSPFKIYYEINLPEKYKINNERISVKLRVPNNDENMVCTMMGPTYPQINIIEVK